VPKKPRPSARPVLYYSSAVNSLCEFVNHTAYGVGSAKTSVTPSLQSATARQLMESSARPHSRLPAPSPLHGRAKLPGAGPPFAISIRHERGQNVWTVRIRRWGGFDPSAWFLCIPLGQIDPIETWPLPRHNKKGWPQPNRLGPPLEPFASAISRRLRERREPRESGIPRLRT
jgi:hypothetical protein